MLIFHRYDVYIILNNFVFQIPFQKGFSDIFNCFKVFSFRLYFMNFPLNIPAVVLPIIIPKFEVQRDLVLHLKQSPWVSCFPHERKFKSLQIVSNRMQVSVNIFKLLFQIFHDCCCFFFVNVIIPAKLSFLFSMRASNSFPIVGLVKLFVSLTTAVLNSL